MKEVNRYTSNEFHDWQRANLPKHFVMQDIDTWTLIWSDGTNSYEPLALVELKRSFKKPPEWEPYKDDIANYAALKKLADKADLPLWIIYFQKDVAIEDPTLLKIMHVKSISDKNPQWIEYHNVRVLPAAEFKAIFPKIF